MMVIVLIALVSMTLGGIALFRSVDAGALVSANASYQRDVTNRAGEAVIQVLKNMVTSPPYLLSCADPGSCSGNGGGYPYNLSMRVLETDGNGIPVILTQGSGIGAPYSAGLPLSGDSTDASMKVTSSYLVERMTVTYDAPNSSNSLHSGMGKSGGTDPNKGVSSGAVAVDTVAPLYRVSVRVDGPRNTRAYAQAIVAVPVPQ